MDTPAVKIPLLPQNDLDSIRNKMLDVAYAGQSENQKLDLYFPEGVKEPWPLIIHFHGGAFLFGTRRDIVLRPMLRALNHGYALASVEYRLSREARFPALVYDCKAAIRWLRAHAEELGVHPSRFAVWGPSAGGYLAAMMGVTQGNPTFEDLSMGSPDASSDVQAVIDWCGPVGDFCKMDEQILENALGLADHDDPLSPESRVLGHTIQEVRELSRLAAPITHITKDVPPILIQHGMADDLVPVQQSITFAREIERIAGEDRVSLRTYEGRGHHGQPWFDEPRVSDEVFAFLDDVFNRGV
jgi:acetyl esterase/lipase